MTSRRPARRRRTASVVLASGLVWLSGCRAVALHPAVAPESAARAPIHLTLVGTNDLHGWVLEQRDVLPQGTLRYGGLALFSSYLEVLREENPGGVVLVDAGDLFQGTLVSNLSEGAVVIDALDALGYDAASIGNHEFDYGPEGPAPTATAPSMDPFGALKARIAQARFPLLSTNIYEKASGRRPSWLDGDGTVLLERAGVKVGIFGLTTPQTPMTTLPPNVATLRFGALAPEALAASRRLKERGADVVVAVVHAGGKCGDCAHPHDLSSCDLDSAEVFGMLQGLPEGTVDAVVAGHTHARIGHFVGGAAVMENYALGRAFGVIDLWLDGTSKQVLSERTRIESGIEVCGTVDEATGRCDPKALRDLAEFELVPATFRGRTIRADAAMEARLRPAVEAVISRQTQPLGLVVPKTLERHADAESELGSLLADALRALSGADMALVNPGGLRADLKRGPLTYGAVYEVMPFDNQLATVELSGEQLERVLAAAYGSGKGVFQVSGFEVTLERCPVPHRLRAVRLPGGLPLEPSARYRLVMPDFLARGGDGLGPALASLEPHQLDLGETRAGNLRDELVQYWQARGRPLVAPEGGRVVFVGSDAPCRAGVHARPSQNAGNGRRGR